MARLTSTLGDPGGYSTYYEQYIRDRNTTPRALRAQGIYFDLPYHFDRISRVQNRTPYVLANGVPSWEFPHPATIISTGKAPQFSARGAFPPIGDVISKLGNKWRNTDLNIGMYLSPEGRESVEMMANTLGRLSRTALQLRKGDFGGALRNLGHLPQADRRRAYRKFNQGDLSGSFLAAHLGWEPLIKDVYELSNIDPPREQGERIKASKLGTNGNMYSNDGRVRLTFKTTRRLTLMGDIERPPTFTQRFGMDNPFLIAWELVPLSFVADYFLPIGQVIDNMGFVAQARFARMWKKSYSFDGSYSVLPKMQQISATQWRDPVFNKESLFFAERFESYDRVPYSLSLADPLRSLQVNLPSSLMKLGTMASLTHQRLLSLSERRR